MNICVFGNYRVHLVHEYDYITDGEFGEYSYATDKSEWTEELDGREFLHRIIQILSDPETISISSTEGHIEIEQFNSTYGTSSDIRIDYEPSDKELQKETRIEKQEDSPEEAEQKLKEY